MAAVIPLDLDRDEQDTSLLDWITTNVAEPAVLTREILESSFEGMAPNLWTRHFEIGPDDLFGV